MRGENSDDEGLTDIESKINFLHEPVAMDTNGDNGENLTFSYENF